MPSVTLTYSVAEGLRIATAFGRYWRLGRNATAAEVKEYLARQLNGVVVQQERAAEEAKVGVPDLVVT